MMCPWYGNRLENTLVQIDNIKCITLFGMLSFPLTFAHDKRMRTGMFSVQNQNNALNVYRIWIEPCVIEAGTLCYCFWILCQSMFSKEKLWSMNIVSFKHKMWSATILFRFDSKWNQMINPMNCTNSLECIVNRVCRISVTVCMDIDIIVTYRDAGFMMRHLNRGSSKFNVMRRNHSSSSSKTIRITGYF